MKKVFAIILISLLLIIGLVWISKGSLLSRYLSRELGTPVTLKSLTYSPDKISLVDLMIFNPKDSKTSHALNVEMIQIFCPFIELFRTTTNIDQIEMDNINLGLELYNITGTDNNWTRILYNNKKRHIHEETFFIKSLKLNNITVILTTNLGQTKTYGPINMELKNISSKSAGKDIETAIMNQIILEIIKRFNLPELLKQVDPSGIIEKVLPAINIKPPSVNK